MSSLRRKKDGNMFDCEKLPMLCRYIRTINDLTQADIVQRSNEQISEHSISNYENGKTKITVHYLNILAKATNMSIVELLGPDGFDFRLRHDAEYKKHAEKLGLKENADEKTQCQTLYCVNDLTADELKRLHDIRLLPKSVIKFIDSGINELLKNI